MTPGRCTQKSEKWQGFRGLLAWIGIFGILFNLANAGTMGMQAMHVSAAHSPVICSAHGQSHEDPSGQRHSSDCSCCLSLCCAGTVLPEPAAAAPAPPERWIAASLTPSPPNQLQPIRISGGIARAPPQSA